VGDKKIQEVKTVPSRPELALSALHGRPTIIYSIYNPMARNQRMAGSLENNDRLASELYAVLDSDIHVVQGYLQVDIDPYR
jgi:hypothetical protein